MPLPVGPNQARELEELDADEAAHWVFVNTHVNNGARHIASTAMAVPKPPKTGSFTLTSINGVLQWAAG